MKKSIIVLTILLLIGCLILSSCAFEEEFTKEGLDDLYNHGDGISDFELTGALFITKEFMDEYQNTDGNFHFYWHELFPFIGIIEKSFVWMTYDDETYLQAKAAMLDSRRTESEQLDGKTAFGFTFNMNHNDEFPSWFTAFGYNDERKMLVFIGIYISDERKDYENCLLAETDLEAFLQYFYGEWFDWERCLEKSKATELGQEDRERFRDSGRFCDLLSPFLTAPGPRWYPMNTTSGAVCCR